MAKQKFEVGQAHERRAAQARAFQNAQEYILPARFDDTEIPGVLLTTGYISLRERTPEELVSLITRKLVSAGGSVPTELVRKDYSTVEPFELEDAHGVVVYATVKHISACVALIQFSRRS